MNDEPLSDFARSILHAIALRPARHDKIAPNLKSIFRSRKLIVARKIGQHWYYQISEAGRAELDRTP
jgi:hypothetical protein